MIKKSLLIWVLIIPLAIVNGVLRENVLNAYLGKNSALPVNGIILCFFVFFLSLVFIPRLGKGKTKNYILIGLLWLLLTVIFEFTLGFIMNEPLSELIKAYDITTGNLWLFVVLVVGCSPWLTAKIRKII